MRGWCVLSPLFFWYFWALCKLPVCFRSFACFSFYPVSSGAFPCSANTLSFLLIKIYIYIYIYIYIFLCYLLIYKMEKALWADKAMFKIHNILNCLKNYEPRDLGKEYGT